MVRLTPGLVGLPEVWGGAECSIVRVGEDIRDQFAETGHDGRIGDLDLIAGLGIRTLRYPVLWEALSPADAPMRSWDWHDRRLGRLRELGIRPIVGLIHHGSGPTGTDLLDPAFAAGLAAHAGRVAERYPWIDAYTPVNEPLTTARFSCLYGHWYPHARGYPNFLRALVHQCRAVILSMAAIREVAPGAELVQTEDIGRVFSTDQLAWQAEHENERRWLSLDLLFGRVRPGHAWWDLFLENGIAPDELAAFWEAPRPDLIGVNHYLTSDRYLDADRSAYPEHLWGGTGACTYADVEAVRMPGLDGSVGLAARVREVAARYACPIAVTESHHGCTRDEQLRWLREGWDDAVALRREGVDLRAITVWSLFGAVDWNSLLTARHGHYEPGAFDIRGPSPRPTAIATAIASLIRSGRTDLAGGRGPGWWRRPERCYGPDPGPDCAAGDPGPTLVLVGREGALADECRAVCFARGWTMRLLDPAEGVAADMVGAATAILDASATEPGRDLGDLSSRAAAAACAGIAYLLLSGPAVFAHRPGEPHREADRAEPATRWGVRLAAAEALLLGEHPAALILRTGMLFAPGADPDLAPAGTGAPSRDERAAGTHSYVPDLIHVALDLAIDRESGIRHVVNPGLSDEVAGPAPGLLGTQRGCLMPPLGNAVARYEAATAGRRDGARLQAAE